MHTRIPLRLAQATMALATITTIGAVAATPAHAALPDAHGFVLWNGSTVPSGTWPPATTVTPTATPGRYLIDFPGQAAKGGVVHVTAVNDAARSCQAAKWGASGADEMAYVDCYATGGVRAGTAFSAFFESSSAPPAAIPGAFGYVFVDASGGIIDEYNSSGAGNSVTVPVPGVWEVTLKGLLTPSAIDGGIQVTAVNSTVAARCKVIKWNSTALGQVIDVGCFDASGVPLKTRFTLTYQYQQSLYGAAGPPKYFGYAWNVPPIGPPSTNFNAQTGAGTNTEVPAGTGLSLVTFPKLAVLPDNVQVTAAGPGSAYCNLLTAWTHIGADTVVRDVACYDTAGNRITTGFLVSANSQF